MKRRYFLRLLWGTAFGRAVVAGAQQPRVRRIAVFSYQSASDPEAQLYMAAFLKTMQQLGWNADQNLHVDYRWTASDPDRIVKYATELSDLSPEVVLTAGGSHVGALQRASRTLPIVFVQVADAVGGGFVSSLARPGGNATGFTNFDFNFSTKWLELLRQVAPGTTRVAVLEDPRNPSGAGQLGAIQAAATALSIRVVPVSLQDAEEMQRGVNEFARQPNGGLIVTPSGLAIVRRDLVISLAERLNLPAIYPFRYFASGGGLLSYGPDAVDQYRRAAGYVDRILRGAKPADLPVQQSSKIEMVINLKTAKALAISIPQSLLARADDVIQ
ncbi:MAG TPA: ABC transporter substrate-binding protein [Casimicrobiaceae bacterium]|nr:ABC transporter substrate-binding protein [Casimicrobiaceae bacterium]